MFLWSSLLRSSLLRSSFLGRAYPSCWPFHTAAFVVHALPLQRLMHHTLPFFIPPLLSESQRSHSVGALFVCLSGWEIPRQKYISGYPPPPLHLPYIFSSCLVLSCNNNTNNNNTNSNATNAKHTVQDNNVCCIQYKNINVCCVCLLFPIFFSSCLILFCLVLSCHNNTNTTTTTQTTTPNTKNKRFFRLEG